MKLSQKPIWIRQVVKAEAHIESCKGNFAEMEEKQQRKYWKGVIIRRAWPMHGRYNPLQRWLASKCLNHQNNDIKLTTTHSSNEIKPAKDNNYNQKPTKGVPRQS